MCSSTSISSATAAKIGSAIRLGSPDLAEPLSQIMDWIESVDNSNPILERDPRDRARQLFLERP